tara:strand:+ start:296 stop:949 length:654 start_codon:yes stop_codon:yes gene_type:complete
MDAVSMQLLAGQILGWLLSAFVLGVIVLVWKAVVKMAADGVIGWAKSFLLMPTSLSIISAQVSDIGSRLDGFEKRIGSNGSESVFDMLHILNDGLKSSVSKDRILADRDGSKIWHADNLGRCTWASKGLQDLVGSSFDERFRGMSWLNLFHQDDRDEIGAAWANSVGLGNPFVYESRYIHSTGYDIPVHIEAYPLPDGTIIGTVRPLKASIGGVSSV